MNSVRSFFVSLSGFTFVAILALFTASISVVFVGILTVLLMARAVSLRLAPKAAPVRANAPARRQDLRVWNDGRGTIIDM